MTLTSIAHRIVQHLARMEGDRAVNTTGSEGHHRFWSAHARRAGNRVMVRYISYQGAYSLTRAAAEAYLAWLDAGNNGKHWEAREVVSW